jgi:hypothetical protein
VNRDELIAEAAKAWRRSRTGTHSSVVNTNGLSAVLDAVEPLIRADEHDQVVELAMRAIKAGAAEAATKWKAGLRAKVEALPSPMDDGDHISRWVLRADVLNLIDGADQ